MQFAMDLNGEHLTKRSMASALRRTANICGLHEVISRSFKVQETRVPRFDQDLRDNLKASSERTGFTLNDVQTMAVAKLVRMDSTKVTIVTRRSSDDPSMRMSFVSPTSDIRRPSILDMPTGSGKTIVSIIGGILFAIERDEEMKIVPRIIQEDTTGCIVDECTERKSNRKCMVYVPKHLVSHWTGEAETAQKIVKDLRPEWKTTLHVNKKSSSVSTGEKEIAIIICDNSHGPKKTMESGEFFASVCFDETGEHSSNALNQVYDGIRCGRFMMCSADLSYWSTFNPRNKSILRNLLPMWENPVSARYIHSKTSECGITRTAAALSIASLFRKSERNMVLSVSGDPLEHIDLYTSTIHYRPSLLERLGHGSGVDLSDVSGGQMFESKYGVRIYDCKTLGDIVKTMEDKIKEHVKEKKPSWQTSPIERALDRIKSIAGEECPICLDKMDEARLLQPCLHFTCGTCVNRIGRRCPVCRGNLESSVSVEASSNLSLKRPAEGASLDDTNSSKRTCGGTHVDCSVVVSGKALGELFLDEIRSKIPVHPVAGGVVPALNDCLGAIKASHEKRGGGTLKVMLICPGVCVQEESISSIGYSFCPYRTSGTRADPARRTEMDRVIERFQMEDGEAKILSVRDNEEEFRGTVDNMTGLDIDGLDVVLTVGRGSVAQRLGRLCRMSRVNLPKERQSALYVELIPSWA